MIVNRVIFFVMAAFMLWAAFDKVFLNNRFGYGKEFDKGINMMGPLAASMIGFMCLAPVIGKVLSPAVTPLFNAVGADPAIFAGSILPIDMGGFALSKVMTKDSQIWALSGIVLGSMLGATVLYNIPVSISMIDKRHHTELAKGTMLGVIAIPFGTFIGGIMFGIPVVKVVINLMPATVLAVLLALGLWFIPEKLLKGFTVFSRIIMAISTVSFAAAIFKELTGITLIPGMDPIGPQFRIVGRIAITLAGAFPFIKCLTAILSKQLSAIGRKLRVNEQTIAGMLASLANSLPAYAMVDGMDTRGKVVALAFLTPAAYTFAGQLAFASANMPEALASMVVAKLAAGVIAVIFALLFLKREESVKIKRRR